LAVNQFKVKHQKKERDLDVAIFINGIPIAVMELKNPTDENATIEGAHQQIQNYKTELPNLFIYNQIILLSDGLQARVGSLTAGLEWFLSWRTIDGETIAPKGSPELETAIKGIFPKQTILDILRHFVTFHPDGSNLNKKIPAYHQYHAANKAYNSTLNRLQTSDPPLAPLEKGGAGEKIGVIWHTQGSGKSLTMAFYAGKIAQSVAAQNPTIVVLTDRNDLDGQLFETFAASKSLFRQTPLRAENREHLKELLKVASGGIIFTTVQKFAPDDDTAEYEQLSDRRNIIFIADEAHRSQYGLEAKITKTSDGPKISYGFAKYLRDALPNALFIGFTGTPIEADDRDTRQIFGDYLDIYDIQRAVEDRATVPIYYESRIVKLQLAADEQPHIDAKFEEVTEAEETTTKEKLKRKWSQLQAVVGAPKRLEVVAADIVNHFENRQKTLEGKATIVCMSRRICVELYNAIVKLRPQWHDDDDDKGAIKVVMTGSASDPETFQPHIRSKKRRQDLGKRFRNPQGEFKLAIVRDMWLTGFDAPCQHTIYIDKPMQGHGLMQAIARVNRVFRDKPGGLVVDYIGIADNLKAALSHYSDGDRQQTGIQTEAAIALLRRKYREVRGMFGDFNYSNFFTGGSGERLSVMAGAMDLILSLEDGLDNYTKAVKELSRVYALVCATDAGIDLRDEIAFFQAIAAALKKPTAGDGSKSQAELDLAVREIISGAIVSQEATDLLKIAGLTTPNLSIFSEDFLAEVRQMPQKNLAREILLRLIKDQIKTRSSQNLVEARSFQEMLEATLKRYENRFLETAKLIDELIELAREIRDARKRGENLGLTEEEVAFYDALEVKDNAVQVLGDDELKEIAKELVKAIKNKIKVDWHLRESLKAEMTVMVKRLLRKHGYPKVNEEKATVTVIQQATLLSKKMVA
jgi:type I restriction enzyme R subunit